MTHNQVIGDLRRELATAMRDRDRNRKKYEDTLAAWTRDRSQTRERLRATLARERMLLKLLADYIAGELDAETVAKKVEA